MPDGVSLFQDTLIKSLKFGFVDNVRYQEGGYSPQILINDQEAKRYVLADLQEELGKCQAFYISVAFITQSGIALIKSQLSDLMDKGIEGKILISPYLDFNDPIAMRELLKLRNVEVRLTPESMQMHAKFYLFEHEGKQVLISGSSNLTHHALKINYEWNIKLTSTHNGDLIQATKAEFEKIWAKSDLLTEERIASYAKKRRPTIRPDQIQDEGTSEYQLREIKPNKMQQEALKGLAAIRESGKDRALVISATGTGKTFLSAFDVQQFEPERMLFIVHREQILQKSLKDFQKVLQFSDSEAMIYHFGADLAGKKYIFATIQTLSRDANLQLFPEDFFDYILIDEVHKAGAASYKKVMNYFQPEFYLGMTATPERTDGQNIYELFDYNVPYEIRLQDALDNDMLCPFIYYAVKEIEVEGLLVNEKTTIANLTSDERVKHIINKLDFYGVSGTKVKGLIFCSSKKEARELAVKLNQEGKRCRALTGDDSMDTRNDVVAQLENGDLDYILTVDIFNEGIDIPSVNQVVMLRNTQSSIVFVQQLGRGLRKHESKEYVTIIDFIGNYKNNYLIPIALFGDKSMNKDNYRRELREPNILNGLTTINFEEVAKEQIFKSISITNLSNRVILKEAYMETKNRLGRTPNLSDFWKLDTLDPYVFFDNFNHYGEVIASFDKDDRFVKIPELNGFLTFLCKELSNGKRKEDLYLLKVLLEKGQISQSDFEQFLKEAGLHVSDALLRSIEACLTYDFFIKRDQEKYGLPALKIENNIYQLNLNFSQFLTEDYRNFILDIIQTGLDRSEKYPQEPLTIGEKYSRKDAVRLLNWDKDESSTVYGYKVKHGTCPIFVTYHKEEDITETTQYQDGFLSNKVFHWYSRSNRSFKSREVAEIMQSNQTGLALHLFIKKEDGEGSDFYYLGPIHYLEDSALETKMQDGKTPVVTMNFELANEVSATLYDYLTKK
ncbi:DNA/RNA helicase of DEAD/DEAH box family [Streptococcus sp. DD11]|uniref:DUF3427 domain-containing protein n=1 Tax=Streptococcus sp. DD11 TaxID=1777879 RepID=UPI000794FDD9|nr:DEAD/DEAH box helicase [Streptococcus sp. DD11]KXT81502.1 DNA/RNA helicase of DEAD/DEAH box family [Streptococcus sp. DD11]